MEDIAFFWAGQPAMARRFVGILVLLFLVSLARLIFPFGRMCRRVVPTSLVSAIQGKVEEPDAVHAGLQTAEDAFAKLYEMTVADIRLMRLMCTLLILLSLVMVGCAASPVYEGYQHSSHLNSVEMTLLAAVQLLELFGIGLTLSTALCVATNALAWMLQKRKIKWHRFVVDAKHALSVI
jgi:hypothetical protein